jgi:Flp pilus assembly protein protease CpaA
MLGMSIVNWIVMLLTIAMIVEAVIEIRRKRWMAAVISALFAAFLIFWFMPGYQHLWNTITGSGAGTPSGSGTSGGAP